VEWPAKGMHTIFLRNGQLVDKEKIPQKSVTLGNLIVMSPTGSEDDRSNRRLMYDMLEQVLLCHHMPNSL
jgi:hypothetical protein